MDIPATPTGVYTGSVYPDDLSQQRVVHLDQYTGKPLIDLSYADYGPLAKWLEWGINVHMGQEFGLANQLVLLAVCMAIVVLAVSAGVMWWKRRPKGSLGVPPMPVGQTRVSRPDRDPHHRRHRFSACWSFLAHYASSGLVLLKDRQAQSGLNSWTAIVKVAVCFTRRGTG